MNLKSKSFFAHKTINWCSIGAQHATMPEAILPEGAFYGQEAAPLHGITPFNLETV